jgi:hypothetical protein
MNDTEIKTVHGLLRRSKSCTAEELTKALGQPLDDVLVDVAIVASVPKSKAVRDA